MTVGFFFKCIPTIFCSSGVIAILHAHNTKKFFNEGKMDFALKYAQKAERFILSTIILGFMFLIILIAIVEGILKKDKNDWNQWSFTGATGWFDFIICFLLL